VHEEAHLKRINLNQYIVNPSGDALSFFVSPKTQDQLPVGIELSEQGLVEGRPLKGTTRKNIYRIKVTAYGALIAPIVFELPIQIFPSAFKPKVKELDVASMKGQALPQQEQYLFGTTALLLIYFEIGRLIDIHQLGELFQSSSILDCILKRRELGQLFDQVDVLTDQLHEEQEALTNAIVEQQVQKSCSLTDGIVQKDRVRNQILEQEEPLVKELTAMVEARFAQAKQLFSQSTERSATLDQAYLAFLNHQLDLLRTKYESIIESIEPTFTDTASTLSSGGRPVAESSRKSFTE
ncbi:MAG: hypothetical protein KKI20_00880, partial [Gammaproteobacteria bacterium]|nr:hypothetical protein [Gammaproteobacteria bacterium]